MGRPHRSRPQIDAALRSFALENLRDTMCRLKDGDLGLDVPMSSVDRAWRETYLNRAAKWAQIAEALRPEPAPEGQRQRHHLVPNLLAPGGMACACGELWANCYEKEKTP
ncbi:hypothetical protein ACFY7C_19295 [Streptomyces sp. NPDC012769]|uniref:hypothetical protein n=1 Tax=Streptomyces sp. NPDC012769 TaxID=3364848 RepID=UPI00369EAF31